MDYWLPSLSERGESQEAKGGDSAKREGRSDLAPPEYLLSWYDAVTL